MVISSCTIGKASGNTSTASAADPADRMASTIQKAGLRDMVRLGAGDRKNQPFFRNTSVCVISNPPGAAVFMSIVNVRPSGDSVQISVEERATLPNGESTVLRPSVMSLP